MHLRQVIPFVAGGDLCGWDADRSYDLPEAETGGYVPRPPVQEPTAPAYKTALELTKGRPQA